MPDIGQCTVCGGSAFITESCHGKPITRPAPGGARALRRLRGSTSKLTPEPFFSTDIPRALAMGIWPFKEPKPADMAPSRSAERAKRETQARIQAQVAQDTRPRHYGTDYLRQLDDKMGLTDREALALIEDVARRHRGTS